MMPRIVYRVNGRPDLNTLQRVPKIDSRAREAVQSVPDGTVRSVRFAAVNAKRTRSFRDSEEFAAVCP